MKTNKKQLENMVKQLSKLTGENYSINYNANYGGYMLEIINPDLTTRSGAYGMYSRLKLKEMYYYLTGVLDALYLTN